MMNQLFRLTFITFVWKKYKQLIVSTLILILLLWIVEQVQQDFVAYSQLNSDTSYLALSFIVKWAVFTLLCVGFVVVNLSFGKSTLQKKPAKSFFNHKNKEAVGSVSPKKDQNDESSPETGDPFDAIRNKSQLRSKADLLLKKESSKK